MAAISKRALQEGGYEKGTPIVVVGGASILRSSQNFQSIYRIARR